MEKRIPVCRNTSILEDTRLKHSEKLVQTSPILTYSTCTWRRWGDSIEILPRSLAPEKLEVVRYRMALFA